jgi:hypothetical protein
MPGFDGTGPLGLGPGTGWGLGPCGAGRALRRGFRPGFGYGRGLGLRRFLTCPSWRYPSASVLSKQEEIELLSEEAKVLEEELQAIKERLAELQKEK